MHRTFIALLIVTTSLTFPFAVAAGSGDHSMTMRNDTRKLVAMPPEMRTHMLANMRDHLVALGEIQGALAAGKYEKAANIAENRLGMSSLEAHEASRLEPYMPKPMQQLGMAMHRSASRFARTAQEAEVEGGVPRALAALSELTQHCTACHARYRIH